MKKHNSLLNKENKNNGCLFKVSIEKRYKKLKNKEMSMMNKLKKIIKYNNKLQVNKNNM